jgi:hypothetical protein
MGRWNRALARLAFIAAVGGCAFGALAQGKPAATPAKAAPQAKQDAGDATKTKDPAAAQRGYAAGTRAFEAGRMAEAIQQLSAALSAGGLPSQQMAKALYYRGVAYRKQGKPAQAISDLTMAVWLKGGLSDVDRAQAIDNRQAAYREAGLGNTAPPIGAAPPEAPATAASAQAVASPPAAAAQPAAVSAWETETTAQTASPTPVVAAGPAQQLSEVIAGPSVVAAATAPAGSPAGEPASAAGTSSGTTGALTEPAPAAAAAPTVTAAAAEAQPSTTGPSSLAKAGTAISGFFNNLFSTGSGSAASAPATPSVPLTTASTSAPAAVSEWSGSTTVAAAPGAKTAAAQLPWATDNPVAVADSGAAAGVSGEYRLQVAAVRSRDEAERLASNLKKYHGFQIGEMEPVVDEAVIGNMGTFYRVRLGPYADATQPGQLCRSLKPHGFDCLVVGQ